MTDRAKWQSELDALRAMSARVGGDPLLIQGAGGNTSIKIGDTLWIKASGRWLAEAERRDIMVPVRMQPLLEAVATVDPAAEQAQQFVLADRNPSGLRPSIETTVHALMPQRVVVHVHCVDTIALAVRTDCASKAAARLEGLNWSYIPYARPGLPLAIAISEHRKPDSDVLILGNHGLVVAADTVAETEILLGEVKARLTIEPRAPRAADVAGLNDRVGKSPYRLPISEAAHGTALDPISLSFARLGSLYPDHVIFLGSGSVIAGGGEDVEAVVARIGETPVSILFPDLGVVMRENATPGADAMARCLSDVCARIPAGAPVRPLTEEEHEQLTNWDAEKYRQALARTADRRTA
ncbi:MAG: aldolase [Ahrensia sp.]|nr:aldolase [Ahrensia sp.]|tara:strand:- start:136576 stop:137634 length:1059 start_codon:yes stop_codon:yes gene_type:complete